MKSKLRMLFTKYLWVVIWWILAILVFVFLVSNIIKQDWALVVASAAMLFGLDLALAGLAVLGTADDPQIRWLGLARPLVQATWIILAIALLLFLGGLIAAIGAYLS